MKKSFFWVLLFGSFISCQTGPLEPDPIIPPPVIKYTITASVIGQNGSVSPSSIDVIKGGSVDFLLTLPIGYDPASVTVNGVKTLLTSTTYSFSPSSNSKLEFEVKKNNLGILIYTITASVIGQNGSVSPSSIDVIKGGSVDFLLTLPIGYDPASVTVNGVKTLLTSTTYSFSPSSNSKLEFEVKKNNLGILISGYWKISQWKERLLGTISWTDYVPNIFNYQFLENDRYQIFNSNDIFNSTTLVGNGNYVLMTDSLIIGPAPNGSGGIRNKIITLKGDSLVLIAIARGPVGLGIDREIQQTYVH